MRRNGKQRKLKCPRCKIEFENIQGLTKHAAQCRGWEGTQEARNLLKVDLRPKRIFGKQGTWVEEGGEDDQKVGVDDQKIIEQSGNDEGKSDISIDEKVGENNVDVTNDLVAELEKKLATEIRGALN